MKTISFLILFTTLCASASTLDLNYRPTCQQECKTMKKACYQSKVQECSGDFFCIRAEKSDCRDVYDLCLEKCDASDGE